VGKNDNFFFGLMLVLQSWGMCKKLILIGKVGKGGGGVFGYKLN
jgi:hypothetical protein